MWCAEFVLRIRKEVERGKLPPDVADNFENLYYNYKNAVNILPVSCLVQLDPYSLTHDVCCVTSLACSGPAKWGSKCISDHAFQHDGFIWSRSAGCRGPISMPITFPISSCIFSCSKMHFYNLHQSSCSFAESIYVSALSQGHQRTVWLLHFWSKLH